jgi:hypothetical protein
MIKIVMNVIHIHSDPHCFRMKVLLKFVLILSFCCSILAEKQCDNTLPDRTLCGANDYVSVADPNSCWKYYECDSGCVTLQTCPDDYKFDVYYAWCTYADGVPILPSSVPVGNCSSN